MAFGCWGVGVEVREPVLCGFSEVTLQMSERSDPTFRGSGGERAGGGGEGEDRCFSDPSPHIPEGPDVPSVPWWGWKLWASACVGNWEERPRIGSKAGRSTRDRGRGALVPVR